MTGGSGKTLSPVAPPSAAERLLGLAGILGGVVFLAAVVIGIPFGLNDVRLIIFNLGAMAVILAMYRRPATGSRTLFRAASIAAFVANAWHLAMVVLAIGHASPFAGDFGSVYFSASLAMWLADAAFGAAVLRSGVVSRWGPLALAIGSILTIAGMGRLGLTSPANPTIFHPVALTGVILHGLGWVLLGLDLVSGGRLVVPDPRPRGVSRA